MGECGIAPSKMIQTFEVQGGGNKERGEGQSIQREYVWQTRASILVRLSSMTA